MNIETNSLTEYIQLEINKFKERWGLEPNGILMHSIALKHITDELPFTSKDTAELIIGGRQLPTFLGIKIYTSEDIKVLEIRFVI